MQEPDDNAQEPVAPIEDAAGSRRTLSRRGLLGLAGAAGAGLVVGGAAGAGIAAAAVGAASASSDRYAFFGRHQAGIVTPAQDRLHFAAFDLASGTTRDDLVALLAEWTDAAARMTQGLEVGESGAVGGSPYAPPDDTGEALGLAASGLTLTFGFGPTLFETADGVDRFGIADRRPAALQPLPRFTGDALEPERSGGDLCIQACADDPQVAVHAIRNLSRIAFGRASLRWSQLGFGRTSSTSTSQVTPRNLFGFKDGTANLKAEETSAVDEHVWVQADDGPEWMVGGSYLVARRIRMIIESWDRVQLAEQESLVGRTKGEGGPMSGGSEFTDPDLDATGPDGQPRIADDAHVRLAHPSVNGGIRLLRRGYNFVDGNDELGRLDAGLFFISFQRDPERFVTVQRSLARDGLAEYLRHVGSGVFAIPPGAASGGSIGDGLFA
ncbi:iron uptake transporter deferrochelatase/peroxidase subunit [Homoserinibacter sp. GY 40078]|uniref:iron uptake transporter deferrochelatase/peroxidase subunit n=1 Tax=Homoserinibacter sp. GY 40078 TaxID=2603275 RepID=UPI0011CB127A|nr:iron uptake transporter deferrochelatase/peroxidase subunit [Homoserinibacter sp. GY 40078]TXK19596.1 deferrochelatase/peroxidase EfeB [Homoserinibacter sp. GY 40078]